MDADGLVGHWIYRRPYLWVPSSNYREGQRFYLMHSSELVHDTKGKKTRGKIPSGENCYLIPPRPLCRWGLRYFRVWSPTPLIKGVLRVEGEEISDKVDLLSQKAIDEYIEKKGYHRLQRFVRKPAWMFGLPEEEELPYPDLPTSLTSVYEEIGAEELSPTLFQEIDSFLEQEGVDSSTLVGSKMIILKRERDSGEILGVATLSPSITYYKNGIRVEAPLGKVFVPEEGILELPPLVQYLLNKSRGRLLVEIPYHYEAADLLTHQLTILEDGPKRIVGVTASLIQ